MEDSRYSDSPEPGCRCDNSQKSLDCSHTDGHDQPSFEKASIDRHGSLNADDSHEADLKCTADNSQKPTDYSSIDIPDRTLKATNQNGCGCMNDDRNPEASPECPSSPKPTQAPPTEDNDKYAKHPAMWGSSLLNVIRFLVPDEPLHPGDLNVAEAYAGSSKPVPSSPVESDLSSWSSASGVPSTTPAQGGRSGDTEELRTTVGVPGSGYLSQPDKQISDGLFRRYSGTDKAREIAAQALAAITETPKRSPLPSSPPSKSSKRELETNDDDSTSEPSPKVLRSPIWRSLVPMDAPSEGYWTPNATEDGEKNTPMCPPCRTGKKGRCYGGLPCDRCKEKGYSKERCEGSLVFRFSPRSKRGAALSEKAAKKSPPDSERWRRDAFGRFT